MTIAYPGRPAPPGARATRPRRPHVADPCPLCAADLGGPGHVTRRRVVFTSTPGSFTWRCPECDGVWEDGQAG